MLEINSSEATIEIARIERHLADQRRNQTVQLASGSYIKKMGFAIYDDMVFTKKYAKRIFQVRIGLALAMTLTALALLGLLILPKWVRFPALPVWEGMAIVVGGLLGAPILLTSALLIITDSPKWVISIARVTPLDSMDHVKQVIRSIGYK